MQTNYLTTPIDMPSFARSICFAIAHGPSPTGTAVAQTARPTPDQTPAGSPVTTAHAPVVTIARIKAARLEAGIREARLRLPGRANDIYAAIVKATLADAEADPSLALRSRTEAAIIGAADDAERALLRGWTR